MTAKILVMIASYCDADIYNTVENAIKMAAYPDRIHFAICYQDELNKPYYTILKDVSNTKIILIPKYESKGCCWARNLCQDLYDGEDYILQIDSHLRFVKNWDERMIQQHGLCPSDKAILSAFCAEMNLYDEYLSHLNSGEEILEPGYPIAVYCMNAFHFPLLGEGGLIEGRTQPYPGALLSAHFIFTTGKWIEEVPYDPELCFWGEEISLAVRSYTNGWDIYHPTQTLCYHRYQDEEGESERRIYNDSIYDYQSKTKVRRLLELRDKIEPYGLGNKRTLEEYINFSGIEFDKRLLANKSIAGIYIDGYTGGVDSYVLGYIENWSEEYANIKQERNEEDYPY